MARPIGIAPLTHLELSPPAMVDNAAQAGFDFVGLRLIAATAQEPQLGSQELGEGKPLVREIAKRLAATGLRVVDIEIFRLKPETRVADYEAVLAAGARLGARHALAAPQDGNLLRLAETLNALCELAARYGLVVDLEPTPWYEVNTLRACAGVIALTGRDDIGLVVDPIHFDRVGETPESIRALPASMFRYAQLCDAPVERPTDLPTLLHQARAERLMPGDGGLDLAGIFGALPCGVPLAIEIPMNSLAGSVPADERVRRMIAKTRTLLYGIN